MIVKQIVFGTLFLSGCVASMPVPPGAMHERGASVSILTMQEHMGRPPLIVTLRAETVGLTPPLRLHWNLGNGREWDGPEPPAQIYGAGRYDVILTVTDAAGYVKKSSVAIDSKSYGCGF